MITSLQKFNLYLISESAKSISDINDLIIVDKHTSKEIKLVLFNHITQDIVGYIHATRVGGDQEFWDVERIGAEPGYGPLLYDILLMMVYPFGVKPSSKIKPKALQVWKYYADIRSDVKKAELDSTDKYYVDKYQDDAESQFKSDPEGLKIINTIYYKSPIKLFYNAMEKSKNIIETQKIDKSKLLKIALDYFWQKYEV